MHCSYSYQPGTGDTGDAATAAGVIVGGDETAADVDATLEVSSLRWAEARRSARSRLGYSIYHPDD